MLRSLYTAATGMEAQQLKMDTIANNLANANTTGYKHERPEFADLLSDTMIPASSSLPGGGGQPAPLQVGLGVRTTSTTRDMTEGALVNTGNSLDLAVQGSGYFRIQRTNGDIAYTRAGNFRVDETGRVVTQNGELVEPGINIPANATQIVVKPDGTMQVQLPNKTDLTEVGRLELTTFTNPAGLDDIGNNLFQPTGASGQELMLKPGDQGAGTLSQGYLESSNVQAVTEMIDMITSQRSYEMNSKVIQTADQMLQKLTSLR